MGNDGGSIPKRRELVKDAVRLPTVSELKATILESLGHGWSHCALSDTPLDMDVTVVSDASGRLYNYEAVLKFLMPSDDTPEPVTAAPVSIRSLRDIVKLKFSNRGGKWICPISLKDLGPHTKSVYLVPCGHVFAEVVMTEIKEQVCPECSEVFASDNVIIILPTAEDDIKQLFRRMENLKANGLCHSLKKEKKKKRKGGDISKDGGQDAAEMGSENRSKKSRKEDARISGINNLMAANLTARVLAEQDERNRRRKLALKGTAVG